MGPVPRIKRRFEIGADENKTEDFGESRELIGEMSPLRSLTRNQVGQFSMSAMAC
jgi:hypothetical protein